MAISKLPTQRPGKNNFFALIAIVLAVSALAVIWNGNEPEAKKITLNQFIEEVQTGNVAKITIDTESDRVNLTNIDGSESYTFKEPATTLDDLLKNVPEDITKDIETDIEPISSNGFWLTLLINILPILLIVGFFMFMMRQAQSSNNQAMSFGKSKAKLFDGTKKSTSFSDVAGAIEAKESLLEVVDFLKTPSKYVNMGAKIPKGVLLVGAPGTGKTLLARAVAGEAKVPFFTISGSEFVEMFVGVGASRVRDLFKKAQKNAPCIIFIDEIDAVGRQRGTGLGGGHDEREQTLNQILTEMDGFENETGVIVMAATNRPDVLDPALLRPGRFDRRVMVDLPDIQDREAILKVHGRNKPLDKEINLTVIAQHTPGFSGADLENLMNEAAIMAAKDDRKSINQDDLQESVEKVMMGPERKSRGLSEKEKVRTAYHEVGHAIVGHSTENCDPVHKISIISRGMALGVTWFLPEDDKHLYTKSKFFDDICSLFGGYCAEIEFFGEMSTGASNDIEKATAIATGMVTKYGMSALGAVSLGEQNHEIFLGRDLGHMKNYSEDTAKKVDTEIRTILDAGKKYAEDLIKEKKSKIKEIADDLLKKETLTRSEFLNFFGETIEGDNTKRGVKTKSTRKKTSKKITKKDDSKKA
jgi:cell division protease FtsH